MEHVPVLQVLPAQQGCPEPPQAPQVPLEEPMVVWQTKPPEQVAVPPETALLQQGSPDPPQATQLGVPLVPVAQMVPGAVQRLPEQH